MTPFASAAAAILTTTMAIAAFPQGAHAQHKVGREHYREMVKRHAAEHNLPEELVHRVIMRESKYQPHLTGKGGALGMMQIKLATARSIGYTGTAEGLYDPETNMKYAVRYLAGAYRTANGNHDQTVRYYAAGYYHAAKRLGLHRTAFAQVDGRSGDRQRKRKPGEPLSILPE